MDNWYCCDGEFFSLCRILPFVLRSATEATDGLPQVTLSTHATADQVYGIVELARRWEGPLSLAVFAPGLDAGLAVAQLDRACRCEPAMYKVFFNFHVTNLMCHVILIDPQSFHTFVDISVESINAR